MKRHSKDLVVEALEGRCVWYYITYKVLNYSQPCACICPYVSLMWYLYYWSLYNRTSDVITTKAKMPKCTVFYVNQSQSFYLRALCIIYILSRCEYYNLNTTVAKCKLNREQIKHLFINLIKQLPDNLSTLFTITILLQCNLESLITRTTNYDTIL